MIQALRESPKCKNCNKVLEWLPWKNGKPQRPVDPSTKQPCECWKTKNRLGKGGDYASDDPYNKRRNLKAKDYTKCSYCDGYYETEKGNESHEETYHKDKKVHKGEYVMGDSCFSDELKDII